MEHSTKQRVLCGLISDEGLLSPALAALRVLIQTQTEELGTSYTVIAAIDIEPWGDPDGYFQQAGIQLPPRKPASRRPTVDDLKHALSDLDGYRVTTSRTPSGLDIDVTNPSETDWASIWIDGYAGDDQKPVEVYFHRGAEDLTLRIVGGLAQACGPFLVMINNEVPRWVTG